MTDSQKRQYVSNLYSGPKWKKKVEKMPDGQVLAIYLDHIKDGTKPEHDEDGLHILEPEVEQLQELKPHDPSDVWVNRHLNGIPPTGPHANEDEFPIY